MTRLHEALQNLAEEAPQADLADGVMTRARRRRRARILTGPVMAVGAAAVVTAGSLLGIPGRGAAPLIGPGGGVLNSGSLPKPLPEGHVGPVEYAFLDWCGKAPQDAQGRSRTGACAQWRVVGRSGGQWRVADALGSSSSVSGGSAPLTISEDGRRIAYYRPSDEHFVVRDLLSGHVTVVGRRVPHTEMAPAALMFSGDGRRLAVSFSTPDPVHALLADTTTGTVNELPGCCVIGLGKDASTVTLAQSDKAGTTLLLADPDGRLRDRVPLSPNLHLEGTGNTVAPDGHTLLALPGPEKEGAAPATPQGTLVLVDVRTGKEVGRRRLRLPRDMARLAGLVGWTGETKVVLSALSEDDVPGKGRVMRDQGYVADLSTGQVQAFGAIALRAEHGVTVFGGYGS